MAGHIKILNPKARKRVKRKVSIRLRVSGTPERPRLSVFRSARHVYVQAVDEEGLKQATAGKPKKERARLIGENIGKKLLAQNIQAVVFDRNGFIYHGRVKEVADGARLAGLSF
jgi:large subunit ribosomal protein L18